MSDYKIVINGSTNKKIAYKTEYKEEGAYVTRMGIKTKKKVIISGKVDTNKLEKYEIFYTIKGTKIKKTRKIEVVDNEKPVITIKEGNIKMFVNEDYIEYGVAAEDNFDSDISKKIEKDDSSLDISKIGDYDIIYKECDSSNNCSQSVRKVSVTKGNIVYGTYKQKSDYSSSILKLRGSNMTFEMSLNLCEGMGDIKGTYSVNGNKITLKFKPKQYYGYDGQNNTKYAFSILDEYTIRFDSKGVACGPLEADVYDKIK